ncbi:hypothetical protein EDB81DRAFT_882020 [Dactylonectria macrodidyma]|uniref:2EXR domain-containing protein n=1 Tax=Dactylonectria macrodidyma TaxID=307937 RepID=A0A9P9J6K0_9HYPO|nr:hypothetical protein EDB81DRAFT_882020 [Dactylonectria macrodidyma]
MDRFDPTVVDAQSATMPKLFAPITELDIRLKPKMEPGIKFEIPTDCRDFSPFARLPAEIRHQIWESTLSTPGMHFLKIQSAESSGRWWTRNMEPPHASPDDSSDEDKEDDEIALEVKREVRPTGSHRADLVPLYPSPEADISYYTTLNQEITKLSVTCNEAANVVKRMMARPTTLKLGGGRMISLDISSDIVSLEYVPQDVFEDGFRFTKEIQCAGLERIRKVAVRYCHKWHEQHSPTRCSVCGQIHNTPDRIAYPNHLYQFLARYLPNLEQFYFVDYLILRKSTSGHEETAACAGPSATTENKDKGSQVKFEGGNRTYFEVDNQDWTVKSKVFETLSWLQDRYVKYSTTSSMSLQKRPEEVKFGVLACEWTVGRRAEMKKAPTTPIKKGRNKRAFCEEHPTWRSRRSPQIAPALAAEHPPAEMRANFPFVFGVSGGNEFEFTFTANL